MATAKPEIFSPFVTDIRSVARTTSLARTPDGPAICIHLGFLDEQGRSVAHSVCAIDDIERLGRDMLAIAAAARADDPKVTPIGGNIRSRSHIMRAVHTGGDAA